MLIVGLTGQSGAGKGEFSRIFKSFDGVYCLDTDTTAREVVEKGKPCLKELCEYFGNEILESDGTLDRKKLASIAFADEEKHKNLNRITHFYVVEEIKKWLDDVKKEGAKVAIIDAPLLFESGGPGTACGYLAAQYRHAPKGDRIQENRGSHADPSESRRFCRCAAEYSGPAYPYR